MIRPIHAREVSADDAGTDPALTREGRVLSALIREPLVALGRIERQLSRGTLTERLRKS